MERSVLRLTLSLLAVSLILVASPLLNAQSASFVRGDSNADARLDLSDAIFTLSSLFLGGEQASCSDAADSNDDGDLDISDPLYTLGRLFQGGSEPPSPGLYCGDRVNSRPLSTAHPGFSSKRTRWMDLPAASRRWIDRPRNLNV
jgi:hypothetical protein